APLAEQLRPTSFDTFFGQQDLVSPTSILRRLIEQDRTPSMILWGPTASGKTSLARIIARTTNALFKELSAVVNNTGDVKKVVDDARNVGALTGQRTILFVDEIHRFNKAQQEVLLPHIESGTIVFIGATTENPSFKLTTALLSRCRVFVLHKLDTSDIEKIVKRAINLKRDQLGIAVQNNTNEKETIPAGSQDIGKEDDINKGGDTEKEEKEEEEEKEDNEEDNEEAVVRRIARIADGDARVAINLVDMALDSTDPASALTSTGLSAALKRTHMMYDRVGDSHYDTISAFHKSIRGSDDNAALYWLTRMLTGGEDPLYIARRMIRIASEDIGLADNNALQVAVSAYNAVQFVGMPECDVSLAHCAVYLARAPKSVEVYKAFKEAKMAVADNLSYPIPIHLRNAPTGLMKSLGYGAEYKYNPDYDEPVEQDYLPPELKHLNF
ncbi:P-loop containing nucleoside triphosphate hydrolase protein, partial [Ramicandelaber brevisporus]